MERCAATLDEIRLTFFTKVQEALLDIPPDLDVFLAAPAQDDVVDLKKILLICALLPGGIGRRELGGQGSLAERHGIWKILISTLAGTDADKGWRMAQILENAFLPYASEVLHIYTMEKEQALYPLYCEFPYSENIGTLPDGRNGISVTVPWWTWTES